MSTDPITAALDRLQEYAAGHPEHDTHEIVQRARAALSEPADGPALPEGSGPAVVAGQPSDEELLHMAARAIDPYDSIKPGEYEAEQNCAVEVYGSELCAFARDALARWGNHSPDATEMVPPPEGEAECPGCEGLPTGHNNPCGVCGHFAQPAPPPSELIAELIPELRKVAEHLRDCNFRGFSNYVTRAAELLEQIPQLQHELERERMRLACCGVIAMSDTPESAAKARDFHPDYWSASADDIARQIDELMRLRAQQLFALPAEGEAAELARWLRLRNPIDMEGEPDDCSYFKLARIAELLERQAAPVPVPVAERPWEREGWCGEHGRCWFGREDSDDWSADWTLATPDAIEEFCTYAPQTVCLPAHALPLPAQAGEVE